MHPEKKKPSGLEIIRRFNEHVYDICVLISCALCQRKIQGSRYCPSCRKRFCNECTFEAITSGECKICTEKRDFIEDYFSSEMVQDIIKIVRNYENALNKQFLVEEFENVKNFSELEKKLIEKNENEFKTNYTSTPAREQEIRKKHNFTKDLTAIDGDFCEKIQETVLPKSFSQEVGKTSEPVKINAVSRSEPNSPNELEKSEQIINKSPQLPAGFQESSIQEKIDTPKSPALSPKTPLVNLFTVENLPKLVKKKIEPRIEPRSIKPQNCPENESTTPVANSDLSNTFQSMAFLLQSICKQLQVDQLNGMRTSAILESIGQMTLEITPMVNSSSKVSTVTQSTQTEETKVRCIETQTESKTTVNVFTFVDQLSTRSISCNTETSVSSQETQTQISSRTLECQTEFVSKTNEIGIGSQPIQSQKMHTQSLPSQPLLTQPSELSLQCIAMTPSQLVSTSLKRLQEPDEEEYIKSKRIKRLSPFPSYNGVANETEENYSPASAESREDKENELTMKRDNCTFDDFLDQTSRLKDASYTSEKDDSSIIGESPVKMVESSFV